MGSVLGCLCCGACSACSCFASCCGAACTKSKFTRVGYVILLVLTAIIAWVMDNWAGDWLKKIPLIPQCPDSVCYGAIAVYKLSFALALIFLVLALVMIRVRSSNDPRSRLQDGMWPLKILVWLGLSVAAFFIPNEFYVVYGWIAVVGSFLFILVQLILLVEFAYSWDESWQEKDSEAEGNGWLIAITVASISMFVVSITASVLMYVYYGRGAEACWINNLFVSLNLIFCVTLALISILPKVRDANPRSGLLQSSVITLYSTYLVWSSIASEPDSMGCNPFGTGTSDLALVLGAIFTFIAVCVSTYTAAGQIDGMREETNKPLLSTETEEGEIEDDEDDGVKYNYTVFHIIFMLATMYVATLITNWQTIAPNSTDCSMSASGEKCFGVDQSMASVWIKISSSWLTQLLYLWTLIAPLVLKDRSFD